MRPRMPIDSLPIPMAVEYDGPSGRSRIEYPTAGRARKAYIQLAMQGLNPKTMRSDTMSPELIDTAAVTTEAPATEMAPKAEKAPKAKKAPAKEKKAAKAKPAAKKATKKAAKGKKAKSERAPRAKKEGLRTAQVRILKAMAKGGVMNRKQIAEKAKCDLALLNSWIGSHKEETRKANDAKNFPCLLTLGFLKFAPKQSEEGREGQSYQITAAGKKAAEKL